MSDPVRLLDGELDDFARALLRSEVDDPDHAARTTRVLAGLGLDFPGPGGGDSGGGGPGMDGSGGLEAASGASAVKAALAVGAVVTLGGLASLWLLRSPEPTSPPALQIGVAPTTLPAVAPPISAAPSASAAPSPSPAASSAPKPPPSSAPKPTAPAPSSSLTQELLLLDRARAALARGDAERADAALREYESRYPRGVLAPEARTLRGRIDAARRATSP